MLEFISTLKQRYQAIQLGLVGQSTQWRHYQACIEQLILIEAFLHKGHLINNKTHPVHIAVVGPTQSGKSTLVNLLLNQEAAGVSPLAGFTVHPQAFSIDLSGDALLEVAEHFSGFQKVEQFSLSPEKYNSYSLTPISSAHLSGCMLWDTPDFDSIDAQSYKEGVLKTLALADVLVLVVSKEKYADQSVWDVLALLEPLNQSLLVVINKLVADSEQLIIDSFIERWRQIRSDSEPTIFPILFAKDHTLVEQQAGLSDLLQRSIKQVKRKKHDHAAHAFIRQHFAEWVAPIKLEIEAQTQWQSIVKQTLQDALVIYKRDYLDHPQHYDTFQNALAKLLTLLEVPGVAKILMQGRKVLTWPLRQVFSLGGKISKGAHPTTKETEVLQQIAEHSLLQIGDKVLDQIDQAHDNNKWWKQMNSQLRQDKALILADFTHKTELYHENFKQDIEATAQGLYTKLEEHPAILNSLRATRVTTDAVMLALTVQAGGIGLHDLLIAPAMLSVTSYLAESAVGSYLHRAESELKQRQFNTVNELLFTQVMHQALKQLPEKMAQTTHFNISAEQLAAAEAQLKIKPHGLRIL
ncbi:MAG: GTPase domain-containing protein [Methyloprofundus sp.]|nr:GTPase domain-containing protein [Methyloprofundus sp.]